MRVLRSFTIVLVLFVGLGLIPLIGSSAQTIDTNPPAEPVKLIFIHHSSGENWLNDHHGGLGPALRDNNYFVSDTNYGWGPDSIGDTTDIGHWWNWFLGPNRDTYLDALYGESDRFGDYYSRLADDPGGENEIIMFKGCFPNSYLEGDPSAPPTTGENPLRGQESWSDVHTVANAKGIYNDLLGYFATRPDKLFVVITAPPLMVGETDAAHAANARAFNNWLVNDWLAGYPHPNVAVFDFYNVLTSNGGDEYTHDAGQESGNHHRIWQGAVQHLQTVTDDMAAYPDGDSHPTPAGNQKATAEFVPLLNYYYNRWKPGHSTPAIPAPATPQQVQSTQPAPAPEADDSEAEAVAAAPPSAVAGLIDDFEAAGDDWEASNDGQGSVTEVALDSQVTHTGAGSLRLHYDIVPGGWGYFGRSFDPNQDWRAGQGISLWLHGANPGQWATLTLFSGDPQAATPFETHFELTAQSCDGWVQLAFPWTAFERAEWADMEGLAELNPAQIVGIGLSFGTEGESIENTLWLDEIALATGELPMPMETELTEPADSVAPADDANTEGPGGPAEPVPVLESEKVSQPPTEEEGSGGLCPLSTVMIPLVVAGVIWARRR